MEIVNIDAIVIAEEPKLSFSIPGMKETLSLLLGVERDNIGIKAKTNEGLGLIGKKRAIASWALALVEKHGG